MKLSNIIPKLRDDSFKRRTQSAIEANKYRGGTGGGGTGGGGQVESNVLHLEITGIGDNGLTCVDSESNEYTVLRPYILRRSTYEGGSYTYVGPQSRTGGGVTQNILPAYYIGEMILAKQINNVWEDINTSGKTWQDEINIPDPFTVPVVSTLPPIPSSGFAMVFLTQDNQVWMAYAGQSAWTPAQKLTTIDGTP